jgi:hypothetical protein
MEGGGEGHMRKVTLTVFALLSLMVLMVPLAYALEPADEYEYTSLKVWLEIDSIVAEPYNGEIILHIRSRVFITNIGEHVAHIGWVWEIPEIKSKHGPWTWKFKIGSLIPDRLIDPDQTYEEPFGYGMGVTDPKAFRLMAEVELLNHPSGVRMFHCTESYELPEMQLSR